MMRDRRSFIALGVGALAVAALPRPPRRAPALVRRRIPVMGTIAEAAIPSRDEGWAHGAIGAAFSELRRVEAAMTRFRDDSDVGVLNASCDRWVDVSADTREVLAASVRWAELSGGRFDPCMGRVTELWDAKVRSRPPPENELVRFADAHLWRTLDVDGAGGSPRARLSSADAAVDLGGIAKGFAVDLAAEALRARGVTDGLVNVGGDLVALGVDVTGDPWLVGVRSPDDPYGLAATLAVSDEAVATSGDYVRFFEHAGRRYHHLLNPDTAAPRLTGMRSLTVRAERCLDADAAASALFGSDRARAARMLRRAAGGVRIVHEIEEVTS